MHTQNNEIHTQSLHNAITIQVDKENVWHPREIEKIVCFVQWSSFAAQKECRAIIAQEKKGNEMNLPSQGDDSIFAFSLSQNMYINNGRHENINNTISTVKHALLWLCGIELNVNDERELER